MGIPSTTLETIQRFFARYAPPAIWSATSPLALVTIFHDAEFIRLWKENKGDPLLLQCVLNIDVLGVTRRIRRYVLKDAKEAWRLKESYRDTLAMEAVAVSVFRLWYSYKSKYIFRTIMTAKLLRSRQSSPR
jgi:hypothetical protein